MFAKNKLDFCAICMHVIDCIVFFYLFIYYEVYRLSMTAKTFKVQTSYIKLNLVLCAVALIYQFTVKNHRKAKNIFLIRIHCFHVI